LHKLLATLPQLNRGPLLSRLSCVVVDNDVEMSAAPVVESLRATTPMDIVYSVEPERNFSRVRNRAVGLATGDLIAFIDDDEVPTADWLTTMLAILLQTEADGVLGPVRPYFDALPPLWLRKSRICERPSHPTGMYLHWRQTRTGNALVRRAVFCSPEPFCPQYSTGGEDIDFFKRAIARGHRFIWCEEAPVYEIVPPARWKLSYYLKRAILQGRISLKYACDRPTIFSHAQMALHALAALIIYTSIIPFMTIFGLHNAITFLIKWCHHFGRLSALLGIHLVRERNF